MATGYGVDTWCTDSMRTGRYARGATLVIQALYRRTITSRGTLRGGEEESAYGLDVADYVGEVGDDLAVLTLPGQLQAEFLKDDRVTDIVVEATQSTNEAGETSIVLRVDGVLVDEEEEFNFTLEVNEVTVTLLGVTP